MCIRDSHTMSKKVMTANVNMKSQVLNIELSMNLNFKAPLNRMSLITDMYLGSTYVLIKVIALCDSCCHHQPATLSGIPRIMMGTHASGSIWVSICHLFIVHTYMLLLIIFLLVFSVIIVQYCYQILLFRLMFSS